MFSNVVEQLKREMSLAQHYSSDRADALQFAIDVINREWAKEPKIDFTWLMGRITIYGEWCEMVGKAKVIKQMCKRTYSNKELLLQEAEKGKQEEYLRVLKAVKISTEGNDNM